MNTCAFRKFQLLMLLSTLVILVAAYYFQYVDGLKPCPLCLVQRFCAVLFGLLSILGLCLSTRRGLRAVMSFQIFFAIAGLFFSGRQLWLQLLPTDQVPACLPGLDILMKYYPLRDVLSTLFWGAGECSEVSWKLFGLSMPAWSAIYFSAIFLVSGLAFFLLSPLSRDHNA